MGACGKKYPRYGVHSIVSVLVFLINPLRLSAAPDTTFVILGKVIDAESGLSLAAANVALAGTLGGSATDPEGRFFFEHLKPTTYTLIISFVGYETATVKVTPWQRGQPREALVIALQPKPIRLSEVVVGPGAFTASSMVSPQIQFSKEELRLIPVGINDPMRTLQLLPGVGGNYLNARVAFRGSRPNDALYLIDGIEIYGSLFHLDRAQGQRSAHIDGLLSIIDTEIIEDIYLSLGGFPSRYGNKSGGVVSIKTVRPQEEGLQTTLSLGIARASAVFKGKWKGHSFLFSAQRAYFDLAFALFGRKGTNILPSFYDLFGKYEYLTPQGRVYAQVIRARDDLEVLDKPGGKLTTQRTNYSLTHLWVGVDQILYPSFLSSTIVFSSFLPENSWYDASSVFGPDFRIYEKRAVLYGMTQRFTYDFSSLHSLETGITSRLTRAQYQYHQTFAAGEGDTTQIVNTNRLHRGYDVGFYASYKSRPLGDLVLVDAGFRLDHQTYVRPKSWQWSPRLGIAVQLPYESTLRVGTGMFNQPTDITNLQTYQEGAPELEKTTHYMIGLENRLLPRSEVRIEAYYKRLTPEYKLFQSGVQLTALDGFAYGIDVFVKKQFDDWFFWIGYAYGMAKDAYENIVVYRSLDRRHSFSLNLNVTLFGGLSVSTTFRYATGRPYTQLNFERVETDTGSYWKYRWGPYHAERGTVFSQWNIGISQRTPYSWGAVSWYIQVVNLLNRQGVVKYGWEFVSDGRGGVKPVERNNVDAPRLVMGGVSCEFKL